MVITGETAAESDGQVTRGSFNADRAAARQSLDRLAALDVHVACFRQGEPLLTAAAAAVTRATDLLA